MDQGGKKERKASISAIFILSAPYIMMSYAIIAFIVGLAIYQGFVWTRNLDTDAGKINSRNVFIAYMVSSGFGGVFFSFAGIIKFAEDLLLRQRSLKAKLDNSALYEHHEHLQEDGEPSFKLETYPSIPFAKTAAAAPQSIHTASQPQDTPDESSSGGLAAALEAAAKAHILSAEADRRVAMEYARLANT